MNAPFDPVSFIHRLEAEGIARGAAEAIAQGIEDRDRGDTVSPPAGDRINAMAREHSVNLGTLMVALIAFMVSILGTIIALR